MDTDNSNNSGNNGNKGRFSDRLKKMRRDRLLKRKNANLGEIEEENVLIRGGRNIFKIILALPSVIYTSLTINKKIESVKKVDKLSNKDVVVPFDKEKGAVMNHVNNFDNLNRTFVCDSVNKDTSNQEKKYDERKVKVNKIREMNVSSLKKKKELYLKFGSSNAISDNVVDKSAHNDKAIRIEKLQKEIIGLIKKKLIKNINELEILQSELYLLKELNVEELYLKDCQENIKEIKKLLSKVKSLKEKYDYLKDNVDFEYMLEYGDDLLIDKILELKELCSSDDIRHTVGEYKILDEYKFLYLKIDKLQEDTIKYEEYKNQKAEELKQRDIDLEQLKSKVYDADREKERYERFVREQELFLKDLEDKISHIDSREEVSYRLKGFNQLLGNSFKYLGLLLVNPLKGFIPGIATQTLVTKNLIHNLYNNLEWEENRKMVYESIDYSTSINIAINNLDDTSSLVDSTLEDIVRLKNKYMNEFKQYQYSFSGYRDIIKKINKMENAVLGSKMKIELIKERMKEKERQNSDKIKRVKKLNSSMNN